MSGRQATDTVIPGQFALSVGRADMPSPPGWKWAKLTDIARLESGHTPSRRHPEWWDGDVPWISIPDAREHHGEVIYDTSQHTNDDGLANSAARLLPAGTVCLSRTASVGYAIVMGNAMATSQDFVNWVCSEAVEPTFLQKLFMAEADSLGRFSKGSTHSTIYFPEVKAFHICLPPILEQRRIVDQIDALHARSAAARAALQAIPPLLDRFRQSVLAAAFRGDLTRDWRAQNPDVEPANALLERIRAERRQRWIADYAEKARARAEKRAAKKGQPWTAEDDAEALEKGRAKGEIRYEPPQPVDLAGLPELPKGWCWVRYGDLCAVKHGYAFKSSSFGEDGSIVLTPGNFLAVGLLDFENKRVVRRPGEAEPEWQLSPGELLIVMTDLSKKKLILGAAAILDRPALHNQRIGRVLPHLSTTDVRFLRYLTLQPRFKAEIDTTSTGTLIQHTSPGRIESIAVPLPPEAEQSAIVDAVEERLGFMRSVAWGRQGATGQLDRLDQSILAKAFRGELVPQDPDDEPASVLLERIRAERAAAAPKKTRRRRKPRTPKPAPTPVIEPQPGLPGLTPDG